MNDPQPVRLVQGIRDLSAVAQGLRERQRPTRQARRERFTFQQLHDQVLGALVRADVIDRADVRMRKLRDGLRLPLEPLSHLG